MKTKTYAFIAFLSILLVCPLGYAAEQDNWYLANEWSVSNAQGVAYYEDNATGIGQIYLANGSSNSAKISVFDLNGSLARNITIATNRFNVYDLALDANGTIYIAEYWSVTCLENDGTFKWRKGKNASISNYGTEGSANGEFKRNAGITVNPTSGEIFVADTGKDSIQVLDENGNFVRKFSSFGTAPGQLKNPQDLVFLHDGILVVTDDYYLHYFQSDGTFIKRVNASSPRKYVSAAKDGTLLSNKHLRDADGDSLGSASFISGQHSRTCFTPEGDIIESYNGKIRVWKRAYRTKGLPVRNVIPQPAIRGISQRAGTNIIDLDFEIIDPDDANATVGILAAEDGAFDDTSKWILPLTWVEGTGSKIGTPIATNQIHRVSWNVKPDWPDSTGTLKFEIICHDARRTSPVDLHFISLPLPDGNLTISRSPLKDSDFESYFKFLLSKGTNGIALQSGRIVDTTIVSNGNNFVFTNCGATGKDGPTWTEANASYLGTNLQGNVTMTTQGIQRWIVPSSGTYTIEAIGARGGKCKGASDSLRGSGAMIKADFNLNAGQVLNIVIGQEGLENTGGSHSDGGGGGGGGTFVWLEGQNAPLIVAGGGGGGSITNGGNANFHRGKDASLDLNGTAGWQRIENYGVSGADSSATAGARGWLTMISTLDFKGQASSYSPAGFGGGGRPVSNHAGGGGGGYSGGGSGHYVSNTGFGNGGRDGGGGGGSISNGTNTVRHLGYGMGHGRVSIASGSQVSFPSPSNVLLTSDRLPSGLGLKILMEDLGYRYASESEVRKSSEAATAGSVNKWTANRPIQPRNLPNKVNEYGFDTGSHGGRVLWVVEE